LGGLWKAIEVAKKLISKTPSSYKKSEVVSKTMDNPAEKEGEDVEEEEQSEGELLDLELEEEDYGGSSWRRLYLFKKLRRLIHRFHPFYEEGRERRKEGVNTPSSLQGFTVRCTFYIYLLFLLLL
jgi:hypothetical protein